MADLELRDLDVLRGGAKIVRDVDLTAAGGEVTVILGPNGAGKTTLLESISGVIRSGSGSITLGDVDISRAPRPQRSRLGLAHVEQGRNVFTELSVAENIAVASADAAAQQRSLDLFPELEARLDVAAGLLSGGEQQMVVIARALARNPRMILVDEMSLGLAPRIVHRIMPVFRQLADDGVGVVLVEQFAALALSIGNRGYVINRGRTVLNDECSVLAADPSRVRDAYLGTTANGYEGPAPGPESLRDTHNKT